MISEPRLREDVELLTGMDDHPLVYDPANGTYHRITRSAKVVLSHLDGTRTREELLAFLGERGGRREELEAFLASLEQSGLLVGSQRDPEKKKRIRTSMFMPRIILTRALPGLLEPPAAVLRRVDPRALVVLASLGALVGFPLGVYTLVHSPPPFEHLGGAPFIVAAILQLLSVVVHESAHALVAQVLRVPVRGLGVALLFYFLPLAFVDRTDAYRLRGRGGRVVLALAGVMSDGWLTGVNAVVALTAHGFVQHTSLFLLGFQLVGLVINLNPLLPSDGYTAIEVATGLVDPRGRAFTLLGNLVVPRPLPPYLTNLPRRARLAYLAYGLISTTYVCVLALSMLSALPWIVQGIVASAGR
ncbi:hypothetical protein ACIBHX_12480 [Nonomuraea sp. NPDC050536]|uniref:hypothetical protein n=1 Tax=Nonomuraea sp. NPDC050536 TaxID=3364366 RepID=UPI0037CB26C8